MKIPSLFMACALLTVSQSTLPKKQTKSGKNASAIEDKRSYITEVINDTDCELMLCHPYHFSNFAVIECFELSGDKVALNPYIIEDSKLVLPPRSKTVLSGVFIPFQETKEDKSILSVGLLDEKGEFVQPKHAFVQAADAIYGEYHYPEKIVPGLKVSIFGNHSFSLIFKQLHDDLLYKSVKTGRSSYFGGSLRIALAVNKRECH